MRYLVVILLTFAVLIVFAIDRPGKDPEESWNELINLIKLDPNSTLITIEGPRIAAKRKLAQIEWLKEAVVAEDFEKFLMNLAHVTINPPLDLTKEVTLVFPQIQVLIDEFEKGNFENFDKIKTLWKVGFKLSAPRLFGKWLVESFLENPQLLDWNTVRFLQEMKNKEEIADEIVQTALKYSQTESYYPHLYRIFEVTRNMVFKEPTFFERQLSLYINLLNQIIRMDVKRLTKAEIEEILKQFDSIEIKKDELRNKLAFLIVSAKQAKIPLDGVKTKDSYLSTLIGKSDQLDSKKANYWLVLTILGGILFLISFDRIRLEILLFLRAKKAAIKTCQRILSKDPLNFQIRLKLAALYEKVGDVERAISEYKAIKDLMKMAKQQKT
ncbi:tetratricopeptide repeat protein [Pseudothermotoga thermarum]|uniref:Tetratricopeptide repeat protein n=1 Tax=Pseudothermotoga thermarum DSM 5069 TaxID=688269 RepID=F7YU53_9THEM|nr:hypothetical protein [Pseudothermotoga thermarum]AEH50149.1 hypothetical protein Theth_0042 [Pseudothermotoga thermarum DSM 5069]